MGRREGGKQVGEGERGGGMDGEREVGREGGREQSIKREQRKRGEVVK